MGFPNLLTSNEYQLFVWLNSENFVRSHQLTTAEGIRFAVGCCVVCDTFCAVVPNDGREGQLRVYFDQFCIFMTGIESCRKGDKRMKQAEHPPVTAGANSAAEYSLAIIDQLARIDRTCSKEEMDELVYRLLAFVGGHLGSARENLRMLTLLEEKQKSLEQNLQAVKLEQQMLKVLCKDSTSVYRVDLMNDRAEIVKIEERSNSAGDLLPYGQELFSYAEAVEHYYHKCVLKESAPDFLQFLDAENLMRELRTKDRVSRRYQSVPDAIGNIYFEVRANRV